MAFSTNCWIPHCRQHWQGSLPVSGANAVSASLSTRHYPPPNHSEQKSHKAATCPPAYMQHTQITYRRYELDKLRTTVNVGRTTALLTSNQRIIPAQPHLRSQNVEWRTCIRYLGVGNIPGAKCPIMMISFHLR
ncbi:hypothetical protein EVAR_96860_1 [Eumeta japonica]|uniref:Uncharacterized protein n=1 Tax=Eumeta variegata TaxID=151549 RepID=A0A4C1WLA3_EUMVA|nr:hypothetical protein EVAR_96860_1 [Eumeta japonica]